MAVVAVVAEVAEVAVAELPVQEPAVVAAGTVPVISVPGIVETVVNAVVPVPLI